MSIQHGVRANLAQHAVLAANVAFIGAMVGVERTVVPLLAREVFGVTSATLVLSFIAGFGITKALANLLSGRLADRFGRRRLLVIGWVAGLPVPFLVMLAPSWGWVVGANLLLGAQQGLTWTMTLAMMGDLAGRRRRGLVMGANEFTGYAAIGVATWLTGQIGAAYGLRQAPFWLGVAAAITGLAIAMQARDTLPHATTEPPASQPDHGTAHRTACYQAGLVTKVNDAGVWGLLPLLLEGRGLDLAAIATVAATYPLVWGIGQLVTGVLSDRVGRRPLIVAGMFAQACGLTLLAWTNTFAGAVVAAAILGGGAALTYPTLLAAVGDSAVNGRSASALGTYRFWRDLGFVVGALGGGAVADLAGIPTAVALAALISLLSGLLVAWRLRETLPTSTPVPVGA